jgi:hypothetical protein
MPKKSPTSRTLQLLKAEGFLAEVVERRLPRCFITRDLFGCIDVLAVRAGEPPLGVQATSGSNAAARLAKALAVPELRAWLAAGCRFEVWSWRKAGPAGKRKTWQVRRRAVGLGELAPG